MACGPAAQPAPGERVPVAAPAPQEEEATPEPTATPEGPTCQLQEDGYYKCPPGATLEPGTCELKEIVPGEITPLCMNEGGAVTLYEPRPTQAYPNISLSGGTELQDKLLALEQAQAAGGSSADSKGAELVKLTIYTEHPKAGQNVARWLKKRDIQAQGPNTNTHSIRPIHYVLAEVPLSLVLEISRLEGVDSVAKRRDGRDTVVPAN